MPVPADQPEVRSEPLDVLIVGGGVAALETTLALRDLAGERVALTMLAPTDEFVYRPMTVREPFAYGTARRYPLQDITSRMDVTLRNQSFGWVDATARIVHTDSNEELVYDALVLALGARIRTRYSHAHTIDDRHLDDILHGLIQDVEGGYVKHVAFVAPGRMGWQLPMYELALMTVGRGYEAGVKVSVTIVTPEEAPLAIFGIGASQAIAELLDENGISVITSAYAEVPSWDTVLVNPGDRRLQVDRVVALPELYGPAVRGLPAGEHGFIPIDPHAKVRGVERVYAAGDATEFAIKHGGIAAQQADVAAESIAALAGVPIEPKPFTPTIEGMLLTGGRPRYLRAHITGGHGFSSEVSGEPLWSPPRKIAARYLAPYLDALDGQES